MTRGKFDDVPTEQLFDAEHYRDKPARPKSIKSVAQGKCPLCTRPKLGVIRGTEGHLIWRRHTYITWVGRSIDCVASGVAVCDLPEINPLDPKNPLQCKHR